MEFESVDRGARDEGGDDACWVDRVCDQCGGFIEPDTEHVCRTPVREN